MLEQPSNAPGAGGWNSGGSFIQRVSLTWPVLMITAGLMLLADQFLPRWGFERTWPVLLVVFGITKLIESGRRPRPPVGPRI